MLIEIYKINCAKRSSICATQKIQPALGYFNIEKRYYFGYKIHPD
jgi:hypothetical protein